MNKNEKQQIINMRTKGLSYKEIGETLNISHNTISAFCKRNGIEKNTILCKTCDGTIYGYRLVKGQYVIVPNEAEVIKRIFDEYLSGLGHQKIANHLNSDGVPSRYGGTWNQSVIRDMLKNYTYTGNLVLQKTFRENHLTKKTSKNNGELPKYHSEDSHEAIIDMVTYNKVQEEHERRKAKYNKAHFENKKYPLTGLITCENCGKNYRRKTTKTGIVWICATFNTLGKKHCASKQVPETVLEELVSSVSPIENISSILVSNGNKITFELIDGTEVIKHWADRSRSES